MYETINPANGRQLRTFPGLDGPQIEAKLAMSRQAFEQWSQKSIGERSDCLRGVAEQLEQKKADYAALITMEMGKLLREAKAEIEKCALVCRYYADQGETMLAPEQIASDAGQSYVAHEPLGPVLAVMPWNFPFWQVMRFAAPALVAGNTALLKHASNVPQCALALEAIFLSAGAPPGVFQTMLIDTAQVAEVIADNRVRAVTLTGSEKAGRHVAATAGRSLKKTVLELGGSDPFLVLNDADLVLTVENAVASRFLNCGQSCIAAKRFIVEADIYSAFMDSFTLAVKNLTPGDPNDPQSKLAPMARGDLRDTLHAQVEDALKHNAVAACGGQPLTGEGYYYPGTILELPDTNNPVWRQEIFGPVAQVVRANDTQHAIDLANDSSFGLGASVWSRDPQQARAVAHRLQSGAVFINGLVKSDPRLPFGGIKDSGYGRELCHHGIMEFINIKTIWIR